MVLVFWDPSERAFGYLVSKVTGIFHIQRFPFFFGEAVKRGWAALTWPLDLKATTFSPCLSFLPSPCPPKGPALTANLSGLFQVLHSTTPPVIPSHCTPFQQSRPPSIQQLELEIKNTATQKPDDLTPSSLGPSSLATGTVETLVHPYNMPQLHMDRFLTNETSFRGDVWRQRDPRQALKLEWKKNKNCRLVSIKNEV